MKKHIYFIFLSLFISSTTWAQTSNTKISFSDTIHNFGTIQEIDGIQSYQFKFTNTGNKPLIIKNVKASCGCTTPEWSKIPIASGKSGFIKVSFDPINRPGSFNKSITITSNTKNSPTKLIIKGIVKERHKTIDDKYRSDMNGLKLKNNHIAFTKIYNNQIKTEQITVYNPTKKRISVQLDRIPPHIQIDKTKFTVNPNEKLKISFTYYASKKKDWGFVTDKIYLIVNNNRDSKNRLIISADIQEDFSEYTNEQLANAPRFIIDNKIYNFGEIKEGTRKTYEFKFKNTGKTDLIIHKIQSSCGCTIAKLKSKTIKAGEEAIISVTFNSKGKEGKQHKTITLITNDPKNSTIILRVKGTILP